MPTEKLLELSRDISNQIGAGVSGGCSTLGMLPSRFVLGGPNVIAPKKPVLVLEIGGSHLGIAVVELQRNGSSEFRYHEAILHDKKRLDDLRGYRLFEYAAHHARRALEHCGLSGKRVDAALVFSFRMRMDANGPRVISLGKGFADPKLKGKDPGVLLRHAFEATGVRHVEVRAVLNDSTGALLGATFGEPQRCEFTLIMGTHTNLALAVEGKEIYVAELSHFRPKCEFRSTVFDNTVARRSHLANVQPMRYFGGYWLANLLLSVIETCTGARSDISRHNDLGSLLAELLSCEYKSIGRPRVEALFRRYRLEIELASEKDARRILDIARLIVVRGARLAAASIAGAAAYLNLCACVVPIEGSVYRIPIIATELKRCLDEIGFSKVIPISARYSTVVGAALACHLAKQSKP